MPDGLQYSQLRGTHRRPRDLDSLEFLDQRVRFRSDCRRELFQEARRRPRVHAQPVSKDAELFANQQKIAVWLLYPQQAPAETQEIAERLLNLSAPWCIDSSH